MNLLLLPKYGALAASARQRFLQYVPFLTAHGVRCTVSPLFDDDYLSARFEGGAATLGAGRAALAALLRRGRALLGAHRFDLALLHYEAVPYLPAALERYLAQKVPYVVDYDDAIFHNYDQHRSALVRRLLGKKIERVMGRSRGVLCGSPYLLDYARRVQPRATLLPTVVDLALYPAVPPATAPRPFTVGWIGSPSTAAYLQALEGPLRELARERPMRLLLVGSGPLRLDGVPLEVRPWREDHEVQDLAEMDVGVMPLPDTPWARGKCGFKLVQYMASFVPVVASPVGANRGIVEGGPGGAAGLLATGPAEWLAALRRLRDDAGLRRRLGEAGRDAVEGGYCLEAAAPRLLAFLRETLRPSDRTSRRAPDALEWSQGAPS